MQQHALHSVQVINPPLFGVIAGVVVGLSPMGPLLFLPLSSSGPQMPFELKIVVGELVTHAGVILHILVLVIVSVIRDISRSYTPNSCGSACAKPFNLMSWHANNLAAVHYTVASCLSLCLYCAVGSPACTRHCMTDPLAENTTRTEKKM